MLVPRPELNRHGIFIPEDFKSLASTCFATWACLELRRNRTGVHGFAGRCITTLPHSRFLIKKATAVAWLELETRLELATPTLARLCSTTELFPHRLGGIIPQIASLSIIKMTFFELVAAKQSLYK